MQKKSLHLMLGLVLLQGCANDTVVESTSLIDAYACEEQQRGLERVSPECQSGKPQLLFVDTAAFDSRLSRLLKQQQGAETVTLYTDFDEKKVPERVKKWLSAVQKFDGTVNIQSDSRSFILLAGLMALLTQYAEHIEYHLMYAPVQRYNAILQVNSGMVKKITFIPKK